MRRENQIWWAMPQARDLWQEALSAAWGGKKGSGAPKGSRNALKHGLYSEALTEEERTLWPEVKLGCRPNKGSDLPGPLFAHTKLQSSCT
jgi:hypothetical protein